MRRASGWLILLGLVLGSFTGVLSVSTPACACSCVPVTPAEAQSEADVVLVGTAVRTLGTIDPDSPEPITFQFSVEAVVKGPSLTEPSIQVQTSASSDACGISFEVGARYAVYAVHSDGALFATVCGGTYRLANDDRGPTPASRPSIRPSPALSATPSHRQAETLPPGRVAAIVPAAQTVPASASKATEEDPQMPVEGVITAVGIICILIVAIVLVSRRRN